MLRFDRRWCGVIFAVLLWQDPVHAQASIASGGGRPFVIGFTCSIDPAEAGMRRLQKMFENKNLQPSEALIRAMEQQVGDQLVTLTGVRPTSHLGA